MSKPDAKVVGFWRYDLFPYVLCGAGSFTDMGDFYANNFESTFRRESILAVRPLQEGAKINNALENLRAEHRIATKKLEEEFRRKAEAILPELKRGNKP